MRTKTFNLKKSTLAIMLILLCVCLCGCAQVNFVTYHNSDGSIYEYVHLAIDEQELSKLGYNVSAVKMEIKTNSHLEANSLIDLYRNKVTAEYQSQNLTNDEYAAYYNGILLIEEDWTNGEYLIGLSFNSSTIYKKYYELLNNISFNSQPKVVEKPFYTKTYYYGSTNYGDYSIFNRIYNYYSNTAFASISPQKCNLTYSYSVDTKRFHSDADQVSLDSNGNYLHTWNVSPNEPAREICFYTISANRSMWLIACIGIGLTTSIVLCIIGIIKYLKTKNKNNNNEDSNQTTKETIIPF